MSTDNGLLDIIISYILEIILMLRAAIGFAIISLYWTQSILMIIEKMGMIKPRRFDIASEATPDNAW